MPVGMTAAESSGLLSRVVMDCDGLAGMSLPSGCPVRRDLKIFSLIGSLGIKGSNESCKTNADTIYQQEARPKMPEKESLSSLR